MDELEVVDPLFEECNLGNIVGSVVDGGAGGVAMTLFLLRSAIACYLINIEMIIPVAKVSERERERVGACVDRRQQRESALLLAEGTGSD